MLGGILDTVLGDLSNRVLAWYDPFYWYCFVGAVIVVGVTWLSWFFPVLRSLAGAVAVGVVAFLTGMFKGQRVQDDRAARRRGRGGYDEDGS